MAIVILVRRTGSPRGRPLKGAAAPSDYGRNLMELLAKELIRRLTEGAAVMTASELEVVRKLLGDNTVTLASVRRGDFGDIAQEIAEEYPFGADDEVVQALTRN